MRSLLPSRFDRDLQHLQPIDALQSEVDRVFDAFARRSRWSLAASDDKDRLLVPDMDVHDTKEHVTLSIELPGVDQKDIEIAVKDQMITISGSKKSKFSRKEGEIHRSERMYGAFTRSMSLPFSIDPDKIDATFTNGVLTVTIAKPVEAVGEPRKIEIRSTS